MDDIFIDILDLGTKARNIVLNAGFRTVGSLALSIGDGLDLNAFPKCGKNSAREIMVKLFFYQYERIESKENKQDYQLEVIARSIDRGSSVKRG